MLPPVAIKPKRKFYSDVFFGLFTMTYTLEAIRYDEWVTCTFWPLPSGTKVRVIQSWGGQKTVSVEEARRMWSGMKRNGWKLQAEPVVEF